MSPSHPPDPGAWDAPCPKQGRRERKGEAYSVPYVEHLGEARNWEKALGRPFHQDHTLTRLRCCAPSKPDPLARRGRLHSAFPRSSSIYAWGELRAARVT